MTTSLVNSPLTYETNQTYQSIMNCVDKISQIDLFEWCVLSGLSEKRQSIHTF